MMCGWQRFGLAALLVFSSVLSWAPGSLAQTASNFALPSFAALWRAADAPVASGEVQRSWVWGAAPISGAQSELYQAAPGGVRTVQYFDKARMEDNSWRASAGAERPVTTGRLVVELMTGQLAIGDAASEQRDVSSVSVAGDPGSSPSYGDLRALASAGPMASEVVTRRLLTGGQVVDEPAPPERVGTIVVASEPRYPIAAPFYAFMTADTPANAVVRDPFFVTGLPVTGPAWVDTALDGRPRRVLLQAFERRVLTYAPGNAAGFEVEFGNVGLHYVVWRYGGSLLLPSPDRPVSQALEPTPLMIPDAVRAATPADRLRRFDGRTLLAPPGFVVSLFAVLREPRFAAFSPNGDLYVVDEGQGQLVVLPDRDRDGVADATVVFAEGLRQPHSVAFADGAVLVGETNGVRRLIDRDGDARADETVQIISLPAGQGHWSRTVAVGPDNKLYVSVGSTCNVCIESDWRRAAVLQFNLDGSEGRLFARGLRNSVGLAWQPGGGPLYATENGRDHLGNDAPPEEVNVIVDGGDYGWPRCHGADIADPEFGRGAGACSGQTAPVIAMQAHSAPLGLAFVPATAAPLAPPGNLVIAYHGSWNRTPPTGYKLVQAAFRDNRPTGEVADLVTGFRAGGTTWSRPVGVAFASDGVLFVTDDAGGAIFRIAPAVGSP